MRAEDKELEGPDLEREQLVEVAREEDEEALLDGAVEDVVDLQLDHRSRLFDALQLVLAREEVNLTLLYLPQRETHALETLRAAVRGTDAMGEFVFAEDRRALLEQALAVLQQNLTHGDPAQLAALQSKFETLTAQVGELREQLANLEDAQMAPDELHIAVRHGYGDQPAGDKDDAEAPGDKDTPGPEGKDKGKDKGKNKDRKPIADDRGLMDFVAEALVAMAEVAPSKSSTLAGEERADPTPRSSLTDGPERPEIPKPPSSLYDDDEPATGSPTATHDPAPQRRKARRPEPDGKRGKS